MTTTEPARIRIPEWLQHLTAVAEEPEPADVLGARLIADRRLQQWLTNICPPRHHPATLNSLPPAIRDDITQWANQPAGHNLLLLGPAGTGKTWAALAAARHHHTVGRSVAFWPVVELLDQLRPDGDTTLHALTHVDTLILDDLGAERRTDWTGERLEAVINRRWLNQQTTIATTNLTPDLLRQSAIGDSAFDRLRDNSLTLWLDGPSQRRPQP